jgi:hypothetical protein
MELKEQMERLFKASRCRFCRKPESVHYKGDFGTCADCQIKIRQLEKNTLMSVGKHPKLD